MKKTLEEILNEARDQAQATVNVIDRLIAESKAAGVEWPEEEDNAIIDGKRYAIVRDTTSCDECYFFQSVNGYPICYAKTEYPCLKVEGVNNIGEINFKER